MAEILHNIKPTRMELLRLKKRAKLADKGYKLLKEKRDALISEFMVVIKEYKDARMRVEENLGIAFHNLLMAEVLLGSRDLEQISGITVRDIGLEFTTKNIMGVSLPIMKIQDVVRKINERGYGFLGTTAKLDDAAKNFEESLLLIVKLAEVEDCLRSGKDKKKG